MIRRNLRAQRSHCFVSIIDAHPKGNAVDIVALGDFRRPILLKVRCGAAEKAISDALQ